MSQVKWYLYDERLQANGSMTFNARRAISEGPMYLIGFRLTAKGTLYMPSVRVRGHLFKRQVILPRNAREAIKHKAIRSKNRLLKTTT